MTVDKEVDIHKSVGWAILFPTGACVPALQCWDAVSSFMELYPGQPCRVAISSPDSRSCTETVFCLIIITNLLDKEKEEMVLRERKKHRSGGDHDSSLHLAETNGFHFQILLLPQHRQHGLRHGAPLVLQSACVTALSLPTDQAETVTVLPEGY